ncbi:lasso RiPP family leader peptide-containing protein [Thermodesulfobacteriota bacterium]
MTQKIAGKATEMKKEKYEKPKLEKKGSIKNITAGDTGS